MIGWLTGSGISGLNLGNSSVFLNSAKYVAIVKAMPRAIRVKRAVVIVGDVWFSACKGVPLEAAARWGNETNTRIVKSGI